MLNRQPKHRVNKHSHIRNFNRNVNKSSKGNRMLNQRGGITL